MRVSAILAIIITAIWCRCIASRFFIGLSIALFCWELSTALPPRGLSTAFVYYVLVTVWGMRSLGHSSTCRRLWQVRNWDIVSIGWLGHKRWLCLILTSMWRMTWLWWKFSYRALSVGSPRHLHGAPHLFLCRLLQLSTTIRTKVQNRKAGQLEATFALVYWLGCCSVSPGFSAMVSMTRTAKNDESHGC